MNSPAETYAYMVKSTASKILAPLHLQVLQGVIAGIYLSFGGLMAITFMAHVQAVGGHGPAMLVGGAVFPVGLIAIVNFGGSLFTGNCMYIVPALLNREVRVGRVFGFLCVSWLSNFFGCLVFMYLISVPGEWVTQDPILSFWKALAKRKASLTFVKAFTRGIGANWLVCLALWQGMAAKDGVSKMFGLWFPVFTFVAIGFEHSVANMFLVTNGIEIGGDVSVTDLLVANLLPVTLGNFVSGFCFMGLPAWVLYDPWFQPKPLEPAESGILLPSTPVS
jgi:formate/nitrite transporter